MKVFVTGATGYIGSAVCAAFSRRGHDVCGLVRAASKSKALNAAETRTIVGELQSPETWKAEAKRSDILVHCAVDYSAQQALDRKAVDALLAAADGSRGQVVLYTSGVWVYGGTKGRAADETTPAKPAGLVAWRVDHEKLVLDAATPTRRCLVLRPGCVYGGRGGLTGMWFDSAEKGAAVVAGDGRNRWALVHVEDLAELYALAGESSLSGEVLNAVDQSRETVGEMAAAASRAAGADGKVDALPEAEARKAFGPLAEGLLLDQEVDGEKARRLLGWAPRFEGFAGRADRFYLAWKAAR